MSIENFNLGKTLWLRFFRGAISGAIASMILVQVQGAQAFSSLGSFYSALGVAALTGATTGALLALDKYIRSE